VVLDGLKRRLYVLSFIDNFAPIYALFTLWFIDNSISIAELSIVFVLWSMVGFALGVPSGALADIVDRRVLLGAAFALRATGTAIWLIAPSLPGLIVGAVLWSMHDALANGAWEALIHDELDAIEQAHRYGVVMARIDQFGNLGFGGSTLLAAALVGLGTSIEAVGWVNVAVHGASIALVLRLPDVRWVTADDDENVPRGWWATLRAGTSAARRNPVVLRLMLIGSVIGGLLVVDEYIPLLARFNGASNATVPLIVFVVWLGRIAGGELAARRPNVASPTLASLVLGGTAIIAVAIAFESPWALMAIGIGYAPLQAAWVIADARFQAAAPSATRATATSVRGLGVSLISAAAFVMVGLLAAGNDPSAGLHWVIGILALSAFAIPATVPKRPLLPACGGS
jgi:MFS family permease